MPRSCFIVGLLLADRTLPSSGLVLPFRPCIPRDGHPSSKNVGVLCQDTLHRLWVGTTFTAQFSKREGRPS